MAPPSCWLVNCDVAGFAKRTHVAMLIAIRVGFRQIVVGVLRRTGLAPLADWPLIQEEAVSFLARIRLGGAGLYAPCTRITHFIFLSDVEVKLPGHGGKARAL